MALDLYPKIFPISVPVPIFHYLLPLRSPRTLRHTIKTNPLTSRFHSSISSVCRRFVDTHFHSSSPAARNSSISSLYLPYVNRICRLTGCQHGHGQDVFWGPRSRWLRGQNRARRKCEQSLRSSAKTIHSTNTHVQKYRFSFWYARPQKKLETAGFEDESSGIAGAIDVMSLAEALRPVPGGPFSALTPSMWPQEILAKLGQPEVSEPTL